MAGKHPLVPGETINEEHLYGVSQEQIQQLEDALASQKVDLVNELLQHFHVADVAVVIEYLSPALRHELIEILRQKFDPKILAELDETVRDEVVAQLGAHDLAKAIATLESDDALSLIENLDEEQRSQILDSIPAGNRVILEEVLSYPEDSAARLMQRQVVCVPSFWTVGKVLDFIAQGDNLPAKFYDLFVIDSKHVPIGQVPISYLLQQGRQLKITEIMSPDIKKIPVSMDQEEIALLFRKYGLVSSPVVDEYGHIVGMITVDDVVDVISEEAEEDILRLARVAESDFYNPVLATSYARIRWLFITFLNTLLAVTVISQFQDTIEKMVALAVLMPINASMGGNAGMQVVTVTIRALATRELGLRNMSRAITKEVLVGLINGIVFGAVIGTMTFLIFNDPPLGIVLGAALIANMTWAALGGVLLPIVIAKLGMDPAISAGPLLTTTTDVFGFAVFLGLAKMFLL